MNAFHPECAGEGCDGCDGGYIQVGLASGALYTRKCLDPECGYENGGRVVNDDLPPLPKSAGTCILCNFEAGWLLLTEDFGGE